MSDKKESIYEELRRYHQEQLRSTMFKFLFLTEEQQKSVLDAMRTRTRRKSALQRMFR